MATRVVRVWHQSLAPEVARVQCVSMAYDVSLMSATSRTFHKLPSLGKSLSLFCISLHDECTCSLLYEYLIHEITCGYN